MRLPTFATVLSAALFSVVVTLPFMPFATSAPLGYEFECVVTSNRPGIIQLFYDHGRGYRERDSAHAAIRGDGEPEQVRLPLPAGTYAALRLDPLNTAGQLQIDAPSIRDAHGRIVHRFAARQFQADQQIAQLQVLGEDAFAVDIATGSDDPIAHIVLEEPLHLPAKYGSPAKPLLQYTAPIFAALLLGVAVIRWPPVRGRLARLRTWFLFHPRSALASAAAAAMVASSYPVLFLGQSFVSPNFGVALLYEAMPTLPGYAETEIEDVNQADVGALMWSHLPMASVQARAVFEHGEWPLWNRYNSTGVPLLGQGQSIFGEPLHALVLLSGNAAWAWDVKFLVAKWLLGFGAALAAWLATRHLGAALVIAAVMPFNGYFLFRVNHPAIFSMCYAPWILVCWLGLIRAAGLCGAAKWVGALLIANWCELNSGTVKEAYMSLLTLNLAGALGLLCAEYAFMERIRRFALVGAGGIVFALISSPVWFTFLEALQQSYTSYNVPVAFQVQPSLALAFFDEILFRPFHTPSGEPFVINGSLNFVILLGIIAFLVNVRRICADRLALGLALATALPLAIIFGFIPAHWITRVPFLGNVTHTDNSFFVPAMTLLATLAAFGFSHAARRLRQPEGRGDLMLGGVLLLVLIGQYFAFGQVVHRGSFSVWSWGNRIDRDPFVTAYLGSLVLAVVFLGVLAWRAFRRGRLTLPAALMLALCTVVLTWRFGLHVETGYADYVLAPHRRVDFHARSDAVEFVRTEQQTEPGRFFGFGANAFHGWMNVYGLEGVGGPDPLINKHYRELQDAIGLPREWDWRIYAHPHMAAAQKPALDFLNVRHYFARANDPSELDGVLTRIRRADLDVYRSETAWPRAFFTDCLIRYANVAELGRQIRQGDGLPFAALQSGDELPGVLSAELVDRTIVPARNYRFTSNRTSFEVSAPSAGIAVLSEAWLKDDFRVRLDGRPVAYLRVNHAFKGVWIDEPGTHRIEFEYRPRFFTLTLWLSAAGLFLVAIVGLTLFKRRRPITSPVFAPPPPPATQMANR